MDLKTYFLIKSKRLMAEDYNGFICYILKICENSNDEKLYKIQYANSKNIEWCDGEKIRKVFIRKC